MNSKVSQKSHARWMVILCAALAIVGIFAAAVHAGPLAHNCPSTPCTVATAVSPVSAEAGPSEARPTLVPWNRECPNGKCPKEQVTVNVTPGTVTQPAAVAVEPAEEPFPYGLMFGVLIVAAGLAGIVAFAFRIFSSPSPT
jgi:hypothetical protein